MAKRISSRSADTRPALDMTEDVSPTLRKLRRQGYSSRLCGSRSALDGLLRIANIQSIVIREENDGWTARILFRKLPGLPQVFMHLPEKGSCPGCAQAKAVMRNALRGMMVHTEKTRERNR